MVVKYLIFPFTVQLSPIGLIGFMLSNQLEEVKTDLREFKQETASRFAESRADTARLNRRLDEVHTILFAARLKSRCNSPEKKNKE
ncbi:hypothetical protein MMC07_007870 [Pseudocyphellaria aurata]|nr:hypothetical protein [Pseudocyphellaria aurata]